MRYNDPHNNNNNKIIILYTVRFVLFQPFYIVCYIKLFISL